MLCGRFLFFLIAFLLNTQALFAQLSEEALQRMAQSYVERRNIENLQEHPDLLTDIQDILREHSDVLNTIAQMPNHPEFEPYIEKYKALKAQYTGRQSIVNTKIFLSASPLMERRQPWTLQSSGRCFYSQNWIVIDRGFWEYYQGNDEVREHVLFHELGHCDLNQNHSSNSMMNGSYEEDLLNGRTIDWDPIYKEFFSMRSTRQKLILCSEDNSHLYRPCDQLKKQNEERICKIDSNVDFNADFNVGFNLGFDFICYLRKDDILNELNSNISAFKGYLLIDIE